MTRQYNCFLSARTLLVAMAVGMIPRLSYAVNRSCNPSGSAAIRLGSGAPPPANTANSVLGATPAEIQARFAGVIEQNFHHGNTNQILHNLSSTELADLAVLYKNSTYGNTGPLLEILAKKVNARGLVRVASAFGQLQTITAVDSYAPTAVAERFFASPSLPVLHPSPQVAQAVENGGMQSLITAGGGGPAPTIDMTINEIYLEFRTAPVGSLSVPAALYETSAFVGVNLSGAAYSGYTLGTDINNLIEADDPSLENTIGGTIAQMLSDISSAITELQQGQYESSWNSLFGGSQPVVPQNSGNDFNVTASMAAYMNYVNQNGGPGGYGGGSGGGSGSGSGGGCN